MKFGRCNLGSGFGVDKETLHGNQSGLDCVVPLSLKAHWQQNTFCWWRKFILVSVDQRFDDSMAAKSAVPLHREVERILH